YELDAAHREARAAEVKQRVTELLGEKHTTANHIQYPSGHITPNLDEIVYLPEAEEHEPDPDRPGVLVKSPALAVHISSTGGYTGAIRAYMRDTGHHYYGLNIERRLRAAHPEFFTQKEPA